MAVTRAEVARIAGVSPSTVTYVLTGQRPTSDATRARVMRVVADLGYRPNTAASSLASRAVRTVAVLFRLRRSAIDANDLDYVDGVRTRVEQEGARVVLPIVERTDPAAGLRALVRSQAIDAAVLMDVTLGDSRELLLLEEKVPTVLIGTSGVPGGAPGVDADFDQMARASLEHLARLGHRRVLALMRDVDLDDSNAYHAQGSGIQAAARDMGIELCLRPEPDAAGAGVRLVSAGGLVKGCTAVVTNNPVAATGLTCAARAHGLAIPRDFSVVVLGVTEYSGEPGAFFTEYSVDREAMGRRAGDLLLRLSRGEPVPHAALLPSLLTDHGSTAPPGPDRRAPALPQDR